jgi:hypothetical protein
MVDLWEFKNPDSPHYIPTFEFDIHRWWASGLPYLMFEAALKDLPYKIAEKNGHLLVWDPPGGISSAVRWTCGRLGCDMSLLICKSNYYGRVVDLKCEGHGERYLEGSPFLPDWLSAGGGSGQSVGKDPGLG